MICYLRPHASWPCGCIHYLSHWSPACCRRRGFVGTYRAGAAFHGTKFRQARSGAAAKHQDSRQIRRCDRATAQTRDRSNQSVDSQGAQAIRQSVETPHSGSAQTTHRRGERPNAGEEKGVKTGQIAFGTGHSVPGANNRLPSLPRTALIIQHFRTGLADAFPH